jgi:hypothetical protein
MLLDRYYSIVPVDVTNDIPAGTILEYDAINHRYTPLASGSPAGVLVEDVSASQNPATAKVMFWGIVYTDEIVTTPSEDVKAQLRQIGIFVEEREI